MWLGEACWRISGVREWGCKLWPRGANPPVNMGQDERWGVNLTLITTDKYRQRWLGKKSHNIAYIIFGPGSRKKVSPPPWVNMSDYGKKVRVRMILKITSKVKVRRRPPPPGGMGGFDWEAGDGESPGVQGPRGGPSPPLPNVFSAFP